MWSKTCNFGIVRRENFSLPRQHLREKIFRCPFQYTKVPLEAGAPPPQTFDASYAPVPGKINVENSLKTQHSVKITGFYVCIPGCC
jgi:hypothetical protein